MKPVIGVLPLVDMEKNSYWMIPGYMKAIETAGGLPVMLPLTDKLDELEQIIQSIDGLLLTGGQDIDPSLYNEKRIPQCGESCPERDKMDKLLVGLALEADKPILGICRGLQLLNAVLGGTLYQDIPTQHNSKINHTMKPPYDVPAHTVTVIADTPLASLLNITTLDVNSLHHQAIRDMSTKLEPMALTHDGIVEAVYMEDKYFVWAVQWHPELSYEKDEHALALFNALIQACNMQNMFKKK